MIQLAELFILLVPCIITDLKSRTIPVYYVLAVLLAAVPVNLFLLGMAWWEMVFGIMPGLLLFGAARISRGQIGGGDCVLVLATGALCGFTLALSVILTGFFILGTLGLLRSLLRKRKLRDTYPLAPFLGAAWVLEAAEMLLRSAAGGEV